MEEQLLREVSVHSMKCHAATHTPMSHSQQPFQRSYSHRPTHGADGASRRFRTSPADARERAPLPRHLATWSAYPMQDHARECGEIAACCHIPPKCSLRIAQCSAVVDAQTSTPKTYRYAPSTKSNFRPKNTRSRSHICRVHFGTLQGLHQITNVFNGTQPGLHQVTTAFNETLSGLHQVTYAFNNLITTCQIPYTIQTVPI